MKTVALISGGKDSCFNVLHCIANGHDIVALANLHPPASHGSDELDSHMYQTVGHDVIQCYSKCFLNSSYNGDPLNAPPLPLFRRAISGQPNNTSMAYEPQHSCQIASHDEVEDLYALLLEVKQHIPDIQAVSVGAILSSYQRVRVENVCQRLGLTCLAYLWESDQVELLDSMVTTGMNAILIKVAALGLDERHLGQSLAQLQHHLLNMHRKFELHPCGEGGEYETLTLDCPAFRRRLVIRDSERVVHSNDAGAPVVYIRFHNVDVEDKPRDELVSYAELRQRLAQQLLPAEPTPDPILPCQVQSFSDSTASFTWHSLDKDSSFAPAEFKSVGSLVALSAIRPEPNCNDTIENATRSVMTQLQRILERHALAFHHVLMMTVLVRDMADFAHVNRIYGGFFGINPAARACVQAALPGDALIQIDALAARSPTKSALHVQSISYWASANIGPYSQACWDALHGHTCIAGQIGLVPRTMSMPSGGFAEQAYYSLRHLRRIRAKVGTPTLTTSVAYVSHPQWIPAARACWERDPELTSVALAVVAVPRLPRDALVEYVAVGFQVSEWRTRVAAVTRNGHPLDSDDEDDAAIIRAHEYSKRTDDAFVGPLATIGFKTVRVGTMVQLLASIKVAVAPPESVTLSDIVRELVRECALQLATVDAAWSQVLSARVFYAVDPVDSCGFEQAFLSALTRELTAISSSSTPPSLGYVPCTSIENGAQVLLVLHGLYA